MKTGMMIITAILILTFGFSAVAQEPPNPKLTLEEILSKAKKVAKAADSLKAKTTIRYEQFNVFNRLNKDGSIKSTDTTIFIVTKKGDEQLSRKIKYSSKGETDEGKIKKREKKVSLDMNDPNYDFSIFAEDDESYIIEVKSKSNPPKKGEYEGKIVIDKDSFITRRIDFDVPNPEGALQEFDIDISFKSLEGGLVVPTNMTMRGFVKALLGIVKVRFAGEFKFTNYEIVIE
jgi:hypothetical protein